MVRREAWDARERRQCGVEGGPRPCFSPIWLGEGLARGQNDGGEEEEGLGKRTEVMVRREAWDDSTLPRRAHALSA